MSTIVIATWIAALSAIASTTAACNVSAPATSGPVRCSNVRAGCDCGTVVVLSDFLSTQIALASPNGTTLSPAFLSTASTKTTALSYALSGDVVVPNTRPASGRLVVLDRFGTNVVTWADPTAKVLAQLPVGTGFESNPEDYLELDDVRAYLTRSGVNAAPGMMPFDSGGDVLVLDTRTPHPAIRKSIPMPVEEGLPPKPAGMVRVGATVIAVLQRTSADFMTVGESVLVGLENDAVAWQLHVTGLKNCGRPALSPSGAMMALGCVGQLTADGSVADATNSAIALFDVRSLPPTPGPLFAIADQIGGTTQDGIAWVSETVLFGKTQTPLGGATNNQAFTLDVGTGKATILLTAQPDAQGKGKGLVYGAVRCTPGCGNVCLLADGDLGKLRRWTIASDGLTPLLPDITVDPAVGLPPIGLGGY